MDRVPQILARAIVFTSALVIMSILGVLLHLWLRGPSSSSAGQLGSPPRRGIPILYNELDGSIADVVVRMETLERRLAQEEGRARRLQQENATQRAENERLASRVRNLEGEVFRLRRLLPRPQPQSETPPGTGGTAAPPPPEAGP